MKTERRYTFSQDEIEEAIRLYANEIFAVPDGYPVAILYMPSVCGNSPIMEAMITFDETEEAAE